MADPESKRDSSASVQVLVALIGVLGIVAAALISNWGNIFPKQSTRPVPAAIPTQGPSNTPVRPVHSKGQLVVRGTWSCDLDSGAETAAGADFWWEQDTDVKRYLAPRNGAGFFVVGIRDFDSVKYADLERFRYSSQKIDGSNLAYNQIPKGTVVAYKTNEGRLGKLIVDEYGYNLTIRWMTFE
jgi:hypothetical protein